MNCEKCGKATKGYELHDYCAVCSRNLCADCMAKGHCGNIPALSGMVESGEECPMEKSSAPVESEASRKLAG